MATVSVETVRTVTIKLSSEEGIALQKFLGRSSVTQMRGKGLTEEEIEILSKLFYQLPKTR